MKNNYKFIVIIVVFLIYSCAESRSPNDLGLTQILPKGEYVIYNTGSRHMVKCIDSKGQYYWLNDSYFNLNGIPGRDAHEYRNPTKIIIK